MKEQICISKNTRIWVLFLLYSGITSFAVQITSLSQNAFSADQYKKFEITFTLDTGYSNPFDLDIVDIAAVFTQPDSTQITIPAFFYREYARNGKSTL